MFLFYLFIYFVVLFVFVELDF